MDRSLHPTIAKARDVIESVIETYGFRLTQEVIDHAAFGSAQFEYRHRTHWLRLEWDGKDAHLWLTGAISFDQHAMPGSRNWQPLDATPKALSLRDPGPHVDGRIKELLDQIELFRARRPPPN